MTSPELFEIDRGQGMRQRSSTPASGRTIQRHAEATAHAVVESRAVVEVDSYVVRPLDLHTALGEMTLRYRLSPGGRGALFLLLTPLDGQTAHVQVLRPHAHAECCGESACGVSIPVQQTGGAVMRLDLRIEGPQVGLVPPAMQVRATLTRFADGGLDECTTAHTLRPQVHVERDR